MVMQEAGQQSEPQPSAAGAQNSPQPLLPSMVPTQSNPSSAYAMTSPYVYAIGELVTFYPAPWVEKEFAQAISRAETVGLTDQKASACSFGTGEPLPGSRVVRCAYDTRQGGLHSKACRSG